MRKLIVLPGCLGLGGTTLSLSLMIKGFERCGAAEQLRVLVQADTLLEDYLRQADQGFCLQVIEAHSLPQFVKRSLQWVSQQPNDWPLLLENYTARQVLPVITAAAPALRLSKRPVYHIFRDQALSDNPLGNWLRKLAFTCLSPRVLCNSRFTAEAVNGRLGRVQEILYPPVDSSQFNDRPSVVPPPESLQPILQSGAKVMLTPSRISEPKQRNDKNLRALIPVLVQLKTTGYHYHGVIIGQDLSPGQRQTQALLDLAQDLGVSDRLTILPHTFSIQDYYKHADVVVTLAPREPFGRTVVEAIASGVPVVGSQTGGVGEILRSFAPEWTVDPNDPVAAAQAIVGTATAPQNNLLTQGQRWVEEQCSAANYASRVMTITGLQPARLSQCFANAPSEQMLLKD